MLPDCEHMATPFLIGCGVAAAAYAARGALVAAQSVKANPEVMRQFTAAAAGFRGMGNAFKMPAFMSQMMAKATDGGFAATMSRREASQILGIRCARVCAPRLSAAARGTVPLEVLLVHARSRSPSRCMCARVPAASARRSSRSKRRIAKS